MQSRVTNEILRRAKPIANTQKHIIIIGEYGSGKSWLAKKIHNNSNRANQPFIDVNCYTLAPNEARKKIFGHLRFTQYGAKVNKGFIEQSNGGTLFLKGFDAFSESLQKDILDSVESHEAHHIGSSKQIPINVRIILSIDVKSFYNTQVKFDLLSNTLNIKPYTINYPPLRQRREEICEMAETFLQGDLSRQYNFAATNISPKALYQCIRYDWPGNVQQLKNAIAHAAIISAGNTIQPEHLPNSVKKGQPQKDELEYLEHTYTYRIAEKHLIRDVLERSSSTSNSLNLLGLEKKEFEKKLNDYEIKPELT